MRKAVLLLLAALAALFALPAWAAAPRQGPLVLAAASLQESMNAAADAWAAKGHPRPRLSFAGSSALARQIEAGAPADIFISADEAWMDHLQRMKLLKPGTRAPLLGNSLVLIAPRDAPATRIEIRRGMPLVRALGGGRLALADPDGVPAGIYARQALTALDVWDSLSGRLAPAENVRAALALVSRGAAPLGVVYATDARADRAVKVVGAFPSSSHAPISYPVARIAASTNPRAEQFRRFLISAEGKALFRRFGFSTR